MMYILAGQRAVRLPGAKEQDLKKIAFWGRGYISLSKSALDCSQATSFFRTSIFYILQFGRPLSCKDIQ